MGFTQVELGQVDEALARAKSALLGSRQLHNVTGNVTWRLRYDEHGEITAVSIESSPAGVSPEFVRSAIGAIMKSTRFPRTGKSGVLDFVDLGPVSLVDAAAFNAANDAKRGAEQSRMRRRNIMTAILCIVLAIGLAAAMTLKESHNGIRGGHSDERARCYERGISYYQEMGSYPNLSDGRLASDVVIERCGRTPTAF
jgi:hypothetical protein